MAMQPHDKGHQKVNTHKISITVLIWSSLSADVYLSSLLQPVTSLLCKHSGYTVSPTQIESWFGTVQQR